MKQYQPVELNIIFVQNEDVLTYSALTSSGVYNNSEVVEWGTPSWS